MKIIVLVSCGKTKHHSRISARNLYQGSLFRKSLAYAEKLKPDAIYILSAKYGLVGLDDEIDPYEKTLNKMGQSERREWGSLVAGQLSQRCDLSSDTFVFLAGEVYSKYLQPYIKNASRPLEGLSFGRQLAWLGDA